MYDLVTSSSSSSSSSPFCDELLNEVNYEERMKEWTSEWTHDERTNERMNEWVSEWVSERMDEWMKDATNKQLINHRVNDRVKKRVNEWTNERTMNEWTNNEWMIEWTNEWTNEWTSEWVNEWTNERVNEQWVNAHVPFEWHDLFDDHSFLFECKWRKEQDVEKWQKVSDTDRLEGEAGEAYSDGDLSRVDLADELACQSTFQTSCSHSGESEALYLSVEPRWLLDGCHRWRSSEWDERARKPLFEVWRRTGWMPRSKHELRRFKLQYAYNCVLSHRYTLGSLWRVVSLTSTRPKNQRLDISLNSFNPSLIRSPY